MKIGLRGVQIGSHVIKDWNLGSPALFPIFETAAKLGAAVFVHPWQMMGEADIQRYWLPWLNFCNFLITRDKSQHRHIWTRLFVQAEFCF